MNKRKDGDLKKTEELSQVVKIRLEKINQMREIGINPFANNFKPEHTAQFILNENGSFDREEFDERKEIKYSVAGRVMAINSFGKAAFMRISDRTGKIQIFIRKNIVGDEQFTIFKKMLDIGDIIGVKGHVFRTKTGEITILAETFQLLTKSIRPLPEKYHGLTDVEQRFRQRYVDLIMNPEVREIFTKRAKIVKYIRNYFENRDFIEVETPMMQSVPGGAKAKPFKTFHNALGIPLFLRIAPELYLKRLIVGGLERVFEINRNFRNEGIDRNHNPEFTMLEFYQAYATYEELIELTTDLVSSLVKSIYGTYEVMYGEQKISFAPSDWQRLSIRKALETIGGLDSETIENRDALVAIAKKHEEEVSNQTSLGELQSLCFELLCEDKLINPTFITEFPVEVSPLSRRNEKDPKFVDRFELYINGMEIANAFSELNDPIDQKQRFTKQVEINSEETEDVKTIDYDYVRALEYGMPPTAGEGIGIDRLVMLLTGAENIKEVILFPLLKPEQHQ